MAELLQKLRIKAAESVVHQAPSWKNSGSRFFAGQESFEKVTGVTQEQITGTQKFFEQSYLFGQGSADLQEYFFRYFQLVEPVLHERLAQFSVFTRDKLTIKMPHSHDPIGDYTISINKHRDLFLHPESKLDKEALLLEIVSEFFSRDIEYQYKERSMATKQDPHFSYIKFYILELKGKPHHLFRQLFSEIKEIVIKANESGHPLHDKFGMLTDAWQRNHPEVPFMSDVT